MIRVSARRVDAVDVPRPRRRLDVGQIEVHRLIAVLRVRLHRAASFANHRARRQSLVPPSRPRAPLAIRPDRAPRARLRPFSEPSSPLAPRPARVARARPGARLAPLARPSFARVARRRASRRRPASLEIRSRFAPRAPRVVRARSRVASRHARSIATSRHAPFASRARRARRAHGDAGGERGGLRGGEHGASGCGDGGFVSPYSTSIGRRRSRFIAVYRGVRIRRDRVWHRGDARWYYTSSRGI